MKGLVISRSVFLLLCAAAAIVFLVPHPAHALLNEGDTFCSAQYCYPGKCTPSPHDPACVPCPTITCKDTTNGHVTTGQCVSSAPGVCKAVSAGGSGVDSGLSQLGQALGQLMQQLLQGKGGGGGSPPPPPPGGGITPTTPTGCQSNYFQTSDISQLSDPCAQYVPPTDTTPTSGCDPLTSALGGCDNSGGTTPSPSPDPWGDIFPTTTTSTSTSPTSTNVIYPSVNVPSGNVFLTPGVTGDIQVLQNGATLVVGSRDANSVTAGFYGQGTVGQPQGLVAQWCTDRPWASNFLSSIIAPSFFDGLCEWRGYQVGTPPAPAPAPTPVVQTPPPAPKTPTPVPPVQNTKADIWAVPASVNLGARTSIFWSSQNVDECLETSPDGNFHQTSLSGGAATVPLTSETTFTISCTAADGSHVTDAVTVHIAI